MYYDSPIGRMVLVSDEEGLCGVYFVGQKYDRAGFDDVIEQEDKYLLDAKRWLDIYFQGKVPDFLPKLHMIGSMESVITDSLWSNNNVWFNCVSL